MSTLTKEWLLKTIAELEEERDAMPGAVNEDAAMALEAMKIALASLEAEAVAIVEPSDYVTAAQLVGEEPRSKAVRPLFEGALSVGQKLYAAPRLDNPFCPKCGGTGLADSGGTHPWGEPISIPCDCTAPPAPVSVPDVPFDENSPYDVPCRMPSNLRELIAEEIGILFSDDDAQSVWDVCRRAAMLHGAEPVQGWIPCSERMPTPKTGVMVGCWFGREWAVKWATYLPYHPYAHQSGFLMPGGSWTPTHWMPLPAAPQQEA
ncbi:DUF551 domain-containing protein [Enterobacter hormaechei]